MRVLGDSWCFCNGGGKSERIKAAIFSGKASAMARINGGGTGFLIHRNLLLTTHANLPSVAAAETAEIRLHNGQSAAVFPHRFFITSSILDLAMVGLDVSDGESVQQPHYLKTGSKSTLELGSVVYLLGYTEKLELTVGEGKVVVATDNLIKLSTDGVTWSPGSAGFDANGNLAFMVCDPMKLATSPNNKYSSTSPSSTSSSWKKDHPMQFGIPIPVILDWLNQHWEGNLDELIKPKLPLIRLVSSGQKSDHSCASFTMRRVFKPTEGEIEGTTSSSNGKSTRMDHLAPNTVINTLKNDSQRAIHETGTPSPEIYESPMLVSNPIQLLDINFPPRNAKTALSPYESRKTLPPNCEAESTGSVNGMQSEVQSSSSPIEISEARYEYSSDGETTMYSAETAESRNIPSPREGRLKLNQVGRSQSCVNYTRWGRPVQKSLVARGAVIEKHRSFTKVYSQGAATSQRSNDYFSPTLSSIMKKRNGSEQPRRSRQTAVAVAATHTSPRWMF